MADKTTGELQAVNVSDLPSAADIYDDFKMPGEFQGDAVHVTGAQMKQYAVASVKPFADAADSDAALAKDAAASAENAKTAAQSALTGVQNAIKNIPAGSTPIVNDLTTGGATSALSAEMGKVLGQRPNPQILINADFTNVVDQRGNAVYTGSGYGIDCWCANYNNTKVAAGNDGVTFTNEGTQSLFVQQRIENPERLYGKTVTLSAIIEGHGLLQSTGNVPSSLPSATTRVCTLVFSESPNSGTARTALFIGADGKMVMQFAINVGASYKVRAVKLELGETQTLAHQDRNGDWVLNEISDYATELHKCQRYFQVVNSLGRAGAHLFDVRGAENGKAYGTLVLPVPMRVVPKVTLSGASARVDIPYEESGNFGVAMLTLSAVEASADTSDTERPRLEVSVDDAEHTFRENEWYEVRSNETVTQNNPTKIFLDANM